MSALGEILAGVRKAILIEHRVTELTERVRDLDRREGETRERLIHLEGVIAGARMRAAARRLERP